MAYQIVFYQTSRGDSPIEDFIDKQSPKIQAKMLSLLDLLSKYGPYLKPPYIKKLSTDIYELRIVSKLAIRVLYCYKNGRYHVLHAFVKKGNKTPKKDLDIAFDRFRKLS